MIDAEDGSTPESAEGTGPVSAGPAQGRQPPGRETKHDLLFWKFHESNASVYQMLVRFAREAAVLRGKRKIGIRMVWERMRWEVWFTTSDTTTFKLNDHYHSRYARLIMATEPDLANAFELRELRS